MIYLGKHRVIKELDKQISRGQVLHFLTGDGINDTFFYDLRGGMKNMADTLRDYYLTGEAAFDYFVHVTTASGEPTCFNAEGKIPFAWRITSNQMLATLFENSTKFSFSK